jgi:phosphoenolpyruvate carboxylase
MTHRYNTRFQAKLASSKKTPARTVYRTRFQEQCTINTIKKLQHQCIANPRGIANLQALINLYKYLQTCTEFIKSYERLCRVIERKTNELQDDIPVEIERIHRGECGYAREDKLFELQETLEEFLVKMNQ